MPRKPISANSLHQLLVGRVVGLLAVARDFRQPRLRVAARGLLQRALLVSQLEFHGRSRLRGVLSDLYFDLAVHDADGITRQGSAGRRAEHGAGAHVEARTVQRADQAMAAQPAFVQPGIGVGADVVDRVQLAVLGVHDQHRQAADLDATHLARREFGDGQHGDEGGSRSSGRSGSRLERVRRNVPNRVKKKQA